MARVDPTNADGQRECRQRECEQSECRQHEARIERTCHSHWLTGATWFAGAATTAACSEEATSCCSRKPTTGMVESCTRASARRSRWRTVDLPCCARFCSLRFSPDDGMMWALLLTYAAPHYGAGAFSTALRNSWAVPYMLKGPHADLEKGFSGFARGVCLSRVQIDICEDSTPYSMVP